MTEIRKKVLEVCKTAEIADEWSYSKYAVYPDYDLRDESEWRTFVKHRAIHAFRASLFSNMRMEQETIQFSETELRDAKVVTAVISWVEKNCQTGTIHLQVAHCSRIFGNHY